MKQEHFKTLKDAISDASTIVIATHIVPDADGIGSAAALAIALTQIGKKVFCTSDVPLDNRYHYLDSENLFMTPEEIPEDIDLAIIVDTNKLDRIGAKTNKKISTAKKVVFIDHHPIENPTKDQLVDVTAAATGQLVGEFLEMMEIKFNPNIALPIYTAIVIDTSSFRYPTVSARTHRLVAKLLDTGLKVPHAYNEIYGTNDITHLHFLGAILSKASLSPNKKVAWISITQELQDQYNPDIEDTHAFINHLLILEDVKVSLMFRDDGHEVKISMRSHHLDIAPFAMSLQGGGHAHSAATIILKNGKSFDEILEDVVNKLEAFIESNL